MSDQPSGAGDDTPDDGAGVRAIASAIQVAGLVWVSAVVAYFGFITGVIGGGGLFGETPDAGERRGFGIGVVMVVVLGVATLTTWQTSPKLRALTTAVGVVLIHVVLFGSYG